MISTDICTRTARREATDAGGNLDRSIRTDVGSEDGCQPESRLCTDIRDLDRHLYPVKAGHRPASSSFSFTTSSGGIPYPCSGAGYAPDRTSRAYSPTPATEAARTSAYRLTNFAAGPS